MPEDCQSIIAKHPAKRGAFAPLVPDGRRAPADRDAALMDQFRPSLEARYPKERPDVHT